MKRFISRYWALAIVSIAALAFFIFSSSFNYLSQGTDFVKWQSPDETANYTVAKLYAETGNLAFFEKYNLIAQDIIHPRSFRSDWGWIKPVSFLGLPILYGRLAHWFGVGVLPYLTPFFGAVALIFFYLLVKRIFNKDIALVSALLASAFPVLVYYSARSMFHNVLFMSALIAGLYFSVRMSEVREDVRYFQRHGMAFIFSFLGGISVGISLTARASELLWVGPLFLCLYVFNIRRLGILRPFLFLYGIFMAWLPVLFWNQTLYGSFFSSGYPELNNSLYSLTQSGGTLAMSAIAFKFDQLKSLLSNIKATIFHFGFRPEQSYNLFNAYVRTMFPWLFWSGLAGIFTYIVFINEYSRRRWLFLIAWLCISLILVIYYGSWTFYDNPDPKSFTIGNSYTRYWLPLYLGALPFASLALVKITAWLRRPVLIWALRLIAVVVVMTLSVQFIWLEPSEGLAVSIDKQRTARQEALKILNLTEKNSVVITRYSDKLLFPERKVVIGLFNDPNMISEYAHLAQRLPVYYYNFSFSEGDLAYLNSGLLAQAQLRLSFVADITDRFSLYKLETVTIDR
jgi:4-amino-4-deoxy-L-arabinose transferase-like glycosyltransferase